MRCFTARRCLALLQIAKEEQVTGDRERGGGVDDEMLLGGRQPGRLVVSDDVLVQLAGTLKEARWA